MLAPVSWYGLYMGTVITMASYTIIIYHYWV